MKSEAGYSIWEKKSKFGGDSSDEDSSPEKLIDQKLVFKYAMNSNHSKIIELTIGKEEITHIDS